MHVTSRLVYSWSYRWSSNLLTDDPEGVTFWKVSHGIRLSGMPGFAGTLSEMQRWQVTMLAPQANQLTSVVHDALANGNAGRH